MAFIANILTPNRLGFGKDQMAFILSPTSALQQEVLWTDRFCS